MYGEKTEKDSALRRLILGYSMENCENIPAADEATLNNAIEEIVYFQWSLNIGGIVPEYAKQRIREILGKFNKSDRYIIWESVEKKLKR